MKGGIRAAVLAAAQFVTWKEQGGFVQFVEFVVFVRFGAPDEPHEPTNLTNQRT